VKDATPPVATIASTANQICPGESVTLTASGGVTYNWGNGLTGNGATQTVSPANTTTYTVTAVGANGCVSLPVTITIMVGPPIVALTATKFKICKGESVTLTATGGVTYQWDNGIIGTGPVQIVTPSVTTTYKVSALGGNGCTNNTPATVTIQVVPEITSILQDVYVCAGDYGVLDAGSQPGYTYQWSNGATTSSISVNVPGTYTVIINNGTCTKSYSAKLINPALPKIEDISYEFSTKLLTIKASTTSNAALLYSIDNGITWQNSNVFSNVLANSNYSIRVKLQDANCSSSVDYFTFVMINFITPNGDGRNEKIDFSGISKYPNFSASIYDRYGSEVFRATPSVPYWNGTINGYQLPTTSYWYKVHWQNPASKKLEERSGWVVVKNKN
jgi:gliding motility-associated-like protein